MNRCFFFIASLSLLLSGCRGRESILTFAVGGAPSELDYWEKIISEFENNTKIKVKILRQPTDTDQRRQSLVTPLKAHKRDPDVFLMDVAWVGQFSASGWLLPLDDYIKRDNFKINSFFKPVIEQVDIYKKRIVALPVYLDCGLLYFRKDLLKRYGLPTPKTWGELLKYAEDVQREERKKNPKFFGFVWQGAQYEGLVCTFLEFTASNNGGIVDKSSKINIDRKENIDALRFMGDLIHKYKISPPNTYTEMKEEEVREYFQSGNALFERNWPYAWQLHQAENSPVKGKVGIALLPRFKNGRNVAALGGWHIGISKFSDKKEEAWRLVKFILSYKTQKKLALHLGWNPGRADIYDDPEIREKMGQMEILKEALSHSVARPGVPYYTRISEVIQNYVNGSISWNIKPSTALKDAQENIEKILKQYGQRD